MSKYMVVQDGEIGRGRFGVVEKVRRKQDQKVRRRLRRLYASIH